MTNYKTFYENTVLENIDLTPYDASNDVSIYDKVKTMYNIFKMEYLHEYNIKRYGSEVKIFEEYLKGLPTCLTVPFYNYEILENGKKYGFDLSTELKEEIFLRSYFNKLSIAFFTLKNNL